MWCVLDDSSLVAASHLSSNDLECTLPPALVAQTHSVSVRVKLNGAVSADVLSFTYRPDPVIRAITPVTGPVEGGTLVTLFLQDYPLAESVHMRCKFGSEFLTPIIVAANEVQCITPPAMIAAAVLVQISSNGQDFAGSVVEFQYEPVATIRSIWPTHGISEGGTHIQVYGVGFSERASQLGYLRCRFNLTEIVPAFVDAEHIVCISPASPIGAASVEVSNNLQQFSDSGVVFTFLSSRLMQLTPAIGPVSGGTVVTVTLQRLPPMLNTQCSFGGATVEASFRLPTQLVCISPAPAMHGAVDFVVSSAGMGHEASIPFQYHREIVFSGLVPLWGPRAGGSQVREHCV
eukprot:2037343-Prymnesium_polylepis.2